jgi:hypothetical protein
MADYVVAIPSFKRELVITNKTLSTLIDGGVSKSRIYIFVANKAQATAYEKAVPEWGYHKIVVGKLGIAHQRNFISSYFPENQYIISVDDDVEALQMLRGDKLATVNNIDAFFKRAYKIMKKEHLYIWGVYPVRNPFFMYNEVTTDLKFVIGVLFAYINRKTPKLTLRSVIGKEDIEMSILYYQLDGGVVRFNNIVPKTKFNAEGGLGTDRKEMNEKSAQYLKTRFPDLVTIFHRANGMAEIRLARRPRLFVTGGTL